MTINIKRLPLIELISFPPPPSYHNIYLAYDMLIVFLIHFMGKKGDYLLKYVKY